tara:strand:- start:112 stop:783 length:672 start_codon:yes stop_codon:yes gene_type:complete
MTITSSMTAREIITTAFGLLGTTALGATPESDEMDLGLTHLNWMLKTWQAIGLCNQWRVESITLNWLAATPSATLTTNYLDLTSVRYRNASNIDIDLTHLSLEEFASIPNKTTAGVPNSYAIRKTASTIELNLWPVSASAITIAANAARVIEDATVLDDPLDVPQEWTETVFYCLAARLIAPLRVHISDPNGSTLIRERAESLYDTMKKFDRETASIFFMPAD